MDIERGKKRRDEGGTRGKYRQCIRNIRERSRGRDEGREKERAERGRRREKRVKERER